MVDFGLPNATMHKVGEMRGGRGHPRAVAASTSGSSAEGAGLRRPTCAPRSALPVQARNSSSNIGWAKTKPWTVSQPIARRISAWATVSTASATIFASDALDQLDHRLDDDPRLLAALDVGDQRRVELDPVERHRAQPGEVRIAGAEIVDRDARAVGAQRGDLGEHRLADFHRRALGELELDQRQRHAGVGEGLPQPDEEIGAVELARADVERQPALDAVAAASRRASRRLRRSPSRRSRR